MTEDGGRDDRGDVSLQTVLLTPVVLALIVVIAQAALWFHAVQLADGAAAEAVTAASRYGASPADGEQALRQFTVEAGAKVASALVSGGDQEVVATVTVEVPHVVPWWPGTVTRSAHATTEHLAPVGAP
jgi:Flp pilus assembly protein TadG